MRVLVLVLIAGLFAIVGSEAEAEIDVFDKFSVRYGSWSHDGEEVVGSAKAGEEALLLFDVRLADFDLSFEFKTDTSGAVLMRANQLPQAPVPAWALAEDLQRKTYAYTVEIPGSDPGVIRALTLNGPRNLSFTEFDSKAAQTLQHEEWNAMRIKTEGERIIVWLNNSIASVFSDSSLTIGMLGFHVFSPDTETALHLRNITLVDHGRTGDWRPLFNGRSLDGWVKWGTEEWTVKDSVIAGTSGPDKSEGYLATKEKWSDFHVRGSFKILGEGNYGLFYHSTIANNDEDYPIISGVQTEVAPGWPSPSGWLYESYKRGWLEEPDMTRRAAYALNEGEWNEIEVRSKRNHVMTWVNGVKVADFTDPMPNYTKGAFALQLHAGGVDGILWRDLYVKDVD